MDPGPPGGQALPTRGGGGACLVTGLKLGPKLASFWASGLPSTVGAGATTDMIVSNFVLHWNFKLYLFIQLPFYTQNTRLGEATKSRPGLCTGLHSFAPSRPPTPPPRGSNLSTLECLGSKHLPGIGINSA